jgi:hypothetical protein
MTRLLALGTVEFEVGVTTAYSARTPLATPMSIFGSLGMVKAGLKTLVACVSFGDIEGAKILGNMGFEQPGENLSLIMVEAGKGKNESHCMIIETRIEN